MIFPYQQIEVTHNISSTSGPSSGQDYVIGVNGGAVTKTVNLPTDASSGSSAAKVVGRMYYIFDRSSNASSGGGITINAGTSGIIIDNNASPDGTTTLGGDGDSVTLLCLDAPDNTNGGTWKVI